MLKTVTKIAVTTSLLGGFLYAADFNAEAEKDRLAFQKYFLEKFSDPLGKSAPYFPYVNPEEIKKNYIWPIKLEDFINGTGAWYRPTEEQMAELNEFPPYDIELDEGEKLFKTPFANGKGYKNCFPEVGVKDKYPYFDTKKNEIVTLEEDINACRVQNGEKPLKYGKGDIAKVSAYIAKESRGKTINVKIPNEAAKQAYENGKKMFYTQRGYFYMSCAECHVQGSGQSIRAERLSPALGQVSHFPVYRVKWQEIGTLHRRLAGCVEDTGSEKPKMQSKELKELEYFLTYMSNGLKLNGPDTRK